LDDECQKLLAEKEALIRELQGKVKELELKLKSYEIRDVYRGIIPDEVLGELIKLPPEQMVIEIGKYLREKGSTGQAESRKVLAEMRREMASVEEGLSMSERGVEKTISTITGVARAKVGVDLNFTQKYDHEGSDVAFLAEDIMKTLGVKEGEYISVKKNGVVNLRAIPYSKEGFIVVPAWVRVRIGAKVNDFVEVIKK